MKISLNADCLWWRWGYDESIRLIAEAGFDAIDYYLADFDKEHPDFMRDDWQEIASVKRAVAEKAGMVIDQAHAPYIFKFGDAREYREVMMPRLKRSLEVAAALGARTIVVHPLHYMTYRGNEEKIFEMNMDYYRELLPIAEKLKITMCVENMYQRDHLRRDTCVADTCSVSREFIRYVDALDSPFVKACVDVGHAVLPFGGEEADEMILALGHDRVKALHLHDNDYFIDQHLAPYYGKLDWQKITEALGKIDYDGTFTYELNPPDFLEDKDYLPLALRHARETAEYLVSRIEAARPKK